MEMTLPLSAQMELNNGWGIVPVGHSFLAGEAVLFAVGIQRADR